MGRGWHWLAACIGLVLEWWAGAWSRPECCQSGGGCCCWREAGVHRWAGALWNWVGAHKRVGGWADRAGALLCGCMVMNRHVLIRLATHHSVSLVTLASSPALSYALSSMLPSPPLLSTCYAILCDPLLLPSPVLQTPAGRWRNSPTGHQALSLPRPRHPTPRLAAVLHCPAGRWRISPTSHQPALLPHICSFDPSAGQS